MSALGENFHVNEEELEVLVTVDDPEDPEKEDTFHDLHPNSAPINVNRHEG